MSGNFRFSCLECSAFSERNPEGYTDLRRFAEDVWPAIEQRASSISRVYYLHSRFSQSRQLELLTDRSGLLPGKTTDLGPFGELSPAQLKVVRHLSWYGGNLNVFFRTADATFLKQLIDLWPQEGRIVAVKDLELGEAVEPSLLVLLESTSEEEVLFAFAHDADPMFLLGRAEVLERLRKGSHSPANLPSPPKGFE